MSWEAEDLDLSLIHQRHCTIHTNGCIDGGKQLQLRPDWNVDDFLSACEQRLDLPYTLKRVFNLDGLEITDVMMIGDDALLFVSRGEDFLPPRSQGDDSDTAGERDGSGLPALVGNYKVLCLYTLLCQIVEHCRRRQKRLAC